MCWFLTNFDYQQRNSITELIHMIYIYVLVFKLQVDLFSGIFISSLISLIFFLFHYARSLWSLEFYHIHILFSTFSKNSDLTIANQKTTDDLTKVKGELIRKDKQLETNKVQIEKLKQLECTLKSKNEGYEQEITK